MELSSADAEQQQRATTATEGAAGREEAALHVVVYGHRSRARTCQQDNR